MRALSAGLVQMAEALAMMVGLPIAGRLSDKITPRPVLIVGLFLLVCATGFLSLLALSTPLWLVILGLILGLVAVFCIPRQRHTHTTSTTSSYTTDTTDIPREDAGKILEEVEI
ncbi:MFS transporter [Dictyobacter arantiisoli]|uniref:Major facilitator superfamily (MFS) profile domain-containing protein n=1 Tax=Dictyobacter arantiisoli TaxID=2014874 RepID=A0A5A5TI97_9CHLR|nr:MFS transporter [Dictyobacter arantiisoli]GCF10783.1 hypothetical protein KDI_43470 [Dictyobacter arantiisoli]